MQDKSFELSNDDSGFLNWASSGLDGPSASASNGDAGVTSAGEAGSSFARPPPPNGTLDDPAPPFERPVPPSSTSKDGGGLLDSHEAAGGAVSPMSSDSGPDVHSTDLGFEKPLPPTKTTGCEDLFKKPSEDMPLEGFGNPAAMRARAARNAGVNRMSWVALLYEYSQGTTMHGLPYITRSARFVARRSAVFLL